MSINPLSELKFHRDGHDIEIAMKDGFPYLYFPKLEETGIVNHLFSTRLGGVSEGIFKSLNLSYHRGDERENVYENYSRVAKALGVTVDDFIVTQQTHTTNLILAKPEDKGRGVTRHRDWRDIDGLLTDVPGICLNTSYADCVPLYFVDPVHRAIATSHSGWRGTVAQMGKVTVERMTKEYGTDPKDLIVAIGPSICQDCYEVSEDVIDEFKKAYPESQWESLFYAKENGKFQLNLWHACKFTLLQAGVLPEHIAVAGLCTCCNPDLMFSHRASHGQRGNLGAFIVLKEEE